MLEDGRGVVRPSFKVDEEAFSGTKQLTVVTGMEPVGMCRFLNYRYILPLVTFGTFSNFLHMRPLLLIL